MISTYLAGPIDVSKMNECKDWRNYITKKLKVLDIKSMNPLGNNGGDRIDDGIRQRLHNANVLGDNDTIRNIVSKIIMPPDLDMVSKCSFLTVWIPEDNGYEICGTYGEATLAFYLKKPVYIVTERRISPCSLPNWLIGCSTKIFTSWDAYLDYIKTNHKEDPISKVLRTTNLSAEELFR